MVGERQALPNTERISQQASTVGSCIRHLPQRASIAETLTLFGNTIEITENTRYTRSGHRAVATDSDGGRPSHLLIKRRLRLIYRRLIRARVPREYHTTPRTLLLVA